MEHFTMAFQDHLDNSKLLGVYSGHVRLPDRYVCRKNDKPFHRFFYIVNGIISFQYGDKKTASFKKGDIAFLPSDITYISEWVGPEEGDYISVNFTLDNTSIIFPDTICAVSKDTSGIYYEMFRAMYNTWHAGALGYKFAMLSDLYRLLNLFFLDSEKRQLKEKYKDIHKGILYIENHYIEDIDIKEIARKCNTSESNFRRLFKQYKHMPPITYRNYLRIKKAQELLYSREYNVTEAAAAVNIFDLCYFNRLFKHFTGVSPSCFVKATQV